MTGILSIRDSLKEAAELEKRAREIRSELIATLTAKAPEETRAFLDAITEAPYRGQGIERLIQYFYQNWDSADYVVGSWHPGCPFEKKMAQFEVTDVKGVYQKLVELEKSWDGLVTVRYRSESHLSPFVVIMLTKS